MTTVAQSNSSAFHTLTDGIQMPPGDGIPFGELHPQVERQLAQDRFLILPENHSAVQAIDGLTQVVLAGKRSPFCPLVLHGRPGTGKTKLTTAVLKAITCEEGGNTARLVSAGELARPDDEGFADHGLLTCDFLIVEDIQHLPGRAADAACDLIDHRTARNKALVITAGSGPAGFTHLPRRLTSRLGAGLVVQLESLTTRSRYAVLAAAAETNNIRLTPDALEWLAQQSDGMRTALGSLQNIAQRAAAFPGPLNQKSVEQILLGTGQPTSTRGETQQIVRLVAAAFSIDEDELLGTCRLRTVLLPRQVAMYLTRELTELSLPQIGVLFSGRDHTTVLHACRKVKAELTENEALASIVKQVKQELA